MATMPQNNMKEENPNTELLVDVLKDKYKTDIAFIHPGCIRGAFSQGEISVRDVNEIFPFKDKPTIVNLTETELVEAMKYSANSMNTKDGKPGLVQVSGMKYAVSSTGELISLFVTDKNGKDNLVNINNPNKDKTYSVVVPSFLARGFDGFTMLNKINAPDTKLQDEFLTDILIEYIREQQDDINIENNNRIKIV